MPFDLSTPTAAQALDLYREACQTGGDWRSIADALALHVKAPRATPAPKGDGEWCEYTDAMHKGRGSMFLAGNAADVTFADGMVIRVSLRHRRGKPLPDWARAMRCAVRFYRAKMAHRRRIEVLAQLPPDKPRVSVESYLWHQNERAARAQEAGEAWAAAQPVPKIMGAVDCTRGARVDVAKANAATERLRN
jgi:hypothetical protein